ncbi:MAG: hypothetical protein AB2A00_04730 [Myxococcota bacterium]
MDAGPLCLAADPCDCWYLEPYPSQFSTRFRVTFGSGTFTDARVPVVAPLTSDVLTRSLQSDNSDVQLARCERGVWTQVHRRLVAHGYSGGQEDLSIAFMIDVLDLASSSWFVLVGSAAPPTVLDDPVEAFPTGVPTTSPRAYWSMAGAQSRYGAVAVSGVPGGTTLTLQGNNTMPLFTTGAGPGAYVSQNNRRMEGNFLTDQPPQAIGGGQSVPVHVRAWVRRTGGGSVLVVARAENVLESDKNGWQLYMEPGFSRTSWEVRDQRWDQGDNDIPNNFNRVNGPITNLNEWAYLEASWNPGVSICLYIDGVREANDSATTQLRQVAAARDFAVGGPPGGTPSNWGFPGEIASVQVDSDPVDCSQGTRPVPTRTPLSATLDAME